MASPELPRSGDAVALEALLGGAAAAAACIVSNPIDIVRVRLTLAGSTSGGGVQLWRCVHTNGIAKRSAPSQTSTRSYGPDPGDVVQVRKRPASSCFSLKRRFVRCSALYSRSFSLCT